MLGLILVPSQTGNRQIIQTGSVVTGNECHVHRKLVINKNRLMEGGDIINVSDRGSMKQMTALNQERGREREGKREREVERGREGERGRERGREGEKE